MTLTMNPCLDISGEVERLEPEHKMRCKNIRFDPGGGGINVSRVITILGGTSTAMFPSGGSIGKRLDNMLKAQNVDSRPFVTEQFGRQSFAVRARDDNNQYRFALPGPQTSEKTWRACLNAVAECTPRPSYVVASGTLPPGVPDTFYAQLAERFENSSTRLVLDTSGEPLKHALEQGVFMVKPNQRELESFCSCSLAEQTEQERVCRELVEAGNCEVLALSLGSEGALLTTPDNQYRAAGLEVRQVSSIGAGDSFVAGMVVSLQQGKETEEAFLYGMACGTAALVTEATELCHREQVAELYTRLQNTQQ